MLSPVLRAARLSCPSRGAAAQPAHGLPENVWRLDREPPARARSAIEWSTAVGQKHLTGREWSRAAEVIWLGRLPACCDMLW